MSTTYVPKGSELTNPAWHVVDAEGQILGRLASRIAQILRGKNKPNFTANMLTGDFVIVVNCEKIAVTGKRLTDKVYVHHSQYPGGFQQIRLVDQLAKHPERVIKSAIKGMLPHNRLGDDMLKRLKIYAGPQHPHQAQKPQPLKFER